jgi:two-component system phosphate regulon sensor histidine kinase PhoR
MTFRSPIFRKLLLSGAILIAVPLLTLDFYLTRTTTRQQVQAVREKLEAQARILVPEASEVPESELQSWAQGARRVARGRVTVVDPRGRVLADSDGNPAELDNHAARPEVRAAMAEGIGASRRHSASVDRDLFYLALRFVYHGREGYVLRLASPLEELEAAIREVHRQILFASLLAAALALGIAYLFSRSITRRISRLRAFAEGLADPHPGESVTGEDKDELGVLGRSLRQMAEQQRELVEMLSLESARRTAILSSMVEGVLAVDNELRVTFCNDSFARAVGIAPPIPERLPLLEIVRDPELLDMLTRVLVSGESLRRRLQLPAAESRTFEVQAAPLAVASRRGAIAILHDITDLERLERVRKDFVANVSHELRTPLTAIRGYAETLLEGALEDKENNRKFLEIIKAHAIRLNNIASDLLVLSELESGARPLERECISVSAALDAAMRTVEAEARVRGVKLTPERIEEVCVMGDKVRLEQALINLLDNAVKFNQAGGEVRVEASPTAEGTARIVIRDTGVGIPSEDLTRIFERFYRVDKARSREVGGTGLGLSIVKHVVERMQGTVLVESQLGKGSTFTVTLPAC